MLDEQLKQLKIVRYEKDYWKELELKSIIGDEMIPSDAYVKDVESQYEQAKKQFDAFLKEMRNMIDKETYRDLIMLLEDLATPPAAMAIATSEENHAM